MTVFLVGCVVVAVACVCFTVVAMVCSVIISVRQSLLLARTRADPTPWGRFVGRVWTRWADWRWKHRRKERA